MPISLMIPFSFVSAPSRRLTQEEYNWHGLEDNSYNYAGENQESYSIPYEALYLWNSLAAVVDPKSGGKQQISIGTQKIVEWKSNDFRPSALSIQLP